MPSSAHPDVTPRTLEILLALADRPRHGYGSRQEVEQRPGGQVVLRSGTLYEAIQRLEGRAWIEPVSAPEGEQESGGPERRFYALTDEGRVALADELGRLQSILDTAAGKARVAKPV